jgi:tetratricopeptide (TPR) repeat protein
LLSVCARISLEPLPDVFVVAGGFLICLDESTDQLHSRTIRLRRLAGNCYVPVDADLVPSLLPDEVGDLTRQRGLVFLPGGESLEFAPDEAIALPVLLRFPPIRRENWESFPDGPNSADRLNRITLLIPDVTPESILETGGADIGSEEPRPPSVGTLRTIGGNIAYGAGRALGFLGTALGIGALARLGASIMFGAAQAVPRLTESILGKQRAALNELLKQFRDGKIEQALKRALPFPSEGGRGGQLAANDQLPVHDTRYSLPGLMGSSGPGSFWDVEADLQRQLQDEYRKAAQAALDRGDYRRAAFIHGRLLGDVRMAASILSKGGLHRDAGILYRDRLGDLRWAAREFEAAGEWDEALRIYRQLREYEAAGDLLHKMGEEEAAIEEYHKAAQELIAARKDYLRAGELMLRKTGRTDLAAFYFALGWQLRFATLEQSANAIPCAMRLIEIYSAGETLESFWELLKQVEDWLEPAGNQTEAAKFFNLLMKLAEQPGMNPHRATIRDRARMGLAHKLRQYVNYEQRIGNVVSDLFGNAQHWSASVVSDANFAVKAALKRTAPEDKFERPFRTIRVGTGTVTAAIEVSHKGDVIVGFKGGAIQYFHAQSTEIEELKLPFQTDEPEVYGLASDHSGEMIAAMYGEHSGLMLTNVFLSCFAAKPGLGRLDHVSTVNFAGWDLSRTHLLPYITRFHNVGGTVAVSTPEGTHWYEGQRLIPRSPIEPRDQPEDDDHLVICPYGAGRPTKLLHFVGKRVLFDKDVIELSWEPDHPPGSTLHTPPIAWYDAGPTVFELAGISAQGVIHWTSLQYQNDTFVEKTAYTSRRPEGYCAVTIWRPGYLIGVTASNRVVWLRAGVMGFQEAAPPTALPFPTPAVACVSCVATREVIVVLGDGELIRVPVPV